MNNPVEHPVNTDYDGTPDNDQVMQDERPPMPVIPVRVEGPVRTAELPARGSGFTTVVVGTDGARILTADPRRKSTLLLPVDADIWLGDSQAQVRVPTTGDPIGGFWPAGTPCPLNTCDEVWASASSATTRITVISEQWAL